MAKKYTGSLTLDWYNKEKAVLLKNQDGPLRPGDIPAPKLNWINRDQSLFYDIVDEEGRGLEPVWVSRNDLRIKERECPQFS